MFVFRLIDYLLLCLDVLVSDNFLLRTKPSILCFHETVCLVLLKLVGMVLIAISRPRTFFLLKDWSTLCYSVSAHSSFNLFDFDFVIVPLDLTQSLRYILPCISK